MIALSAVVAGWESLDRLLDPQPLQHVGAVLAAGILGFAGNEAVADGGLPARRPHRGPAHHRRHPELLHRIIKLDDATVHVSPTHARDTTRMNGSPITRSETGTAIMMSMQRTSPLTGVLARAGTVAAPPRVHP